jgi:hypothetical protein
MSDDTRNDAFSQLEAQERQRMAEPKSVPAPAVSPKTPTCPYCGQPLDGPAQPCPFCPERPQEGQNPPDNGGNEPLKPAMRGYFDDEADKLVPSFFPNTLYRQP